MRDRLLQVKLPGRVLTGARTHSPRCLSDQCNSLYLQFRQRPINCFCSMIVPVEHSSVFLPWFAQENTVLSQVRDLRPGRKYAFRIVVHPIVKPPYAQPPAQPPSPVVVFETPATVPGPPPPVAPSRTERTALMVAHSPLRATLIPALCNTKRAEQPALLLW